jgi:SAM-dependent methyltransferase
MSLTISDAEIEPFIHIAYRLAFHRVPDEQGLRDHTEALRKKKFSPLHFLHILEGCEEFKQLFGKATPMTPLHALHYSRVQLVKSLPKAQRIVDLGGGAANDPDGGLVLMGYRYPFESITIVEPPMAQRHEIYKDLAPGDPVQHDTGRGMIKYLYSSMADMSAIPSKSVDMVFSGESVEHVTRSDLELVFKEVNRILKPDGYFIFDTPNRAITEVQLRDSKDEFINPDHKYEYKHHELVEMLGRHNFKILEAKGLSWCPSVKATGSFDLNDLIHHYGFFDDIENCYLLYYKCQPG